MWSGQPLSHYVVKALLPSLNRRCGAQNHLNLNLVSSLPRPFPSTSTSSKPQLYRLHIFSHWFLKLAIVWLTPELESHQRSISEPDRLTMASPSQPHAPSPVNPDTLITLKIVIDGNNRRFKLALRDLGANVLPQKVRPANHLRLASRLSG